MDHQTVERALRGEGWRDIRVQRDPPGMFYPSHAHPMTTAHVIIQGSMRLILGGVTRELTVGDRCDVPANAEHEARIGPQGCTYVIGEE